MNHVVVSTDTKMAEELDDDTKRLLKEVVDHFDKEDTALRERQIRTWRRLKLFWEGFHRAWYSEVAHDWRIWDESYQGGDTDQAYYDKPINVFRAYLESIIAALSVTVPPITCYPDDAENTLDLATAKAGDKIAELLFRHNDVPLLWLHALFIYCTEGMIAGYIYPESKKEYGTYEDKEYDEVSENVEKVQCPTCGYTIDERSMTPSEEEGSEANYQGMEGDLVGEQIDPMMAQQAMQNPEMMQDLPMMESCPGCGSLVNPTVSQETFVTSRLVGITDEPKTRICMEAYGGLYVKIPGYAKKQSDCPYLIFAYETHYANVIEKYEHLHGNMDLTRKMKGGSGPRDPYEEWGRLSPQYQGDYPENVVTLRHTWLRPAAFNILERDEDVKDLKKRFPDGVKVVLANDQFAEACKENLDDYWTLTYNPLADYLQHDPLGLLLVSIQEITNDLTSLTLQTIEHGIGQTFADPGVLNFNAYRQQESTPGGIYEATAKSGRSISDGFYELRTATLSAEVMPFAQNIQSMAQLVSGALPSLFGGAMQGSGETASQYSMSRAQALQRLQNTWKILTLWWKNIFGKAIPAYINETKGQGDEKQVSKTNEGGFVNTFIRRAELEGKIGRVELEANENLPLTWNQQKDVIMQLLQAGNPEILAILGAPENLPVIRQAIGLTDFFVPGEDDMLKQQDELKLLLESEPIPTGDPMMPEMPSVEVNQEFDNHDLEFEIVRKWIISEAGRQAKDDNPAGYKNVLLHGMMHKQIIQQEQMMAAMQGQGAEPAEQPPTTETQEAPIQGEENVQTQ
jgi:hypothetical protein